MTWPSSRRDRFHDRPVMTFDLIWNGFTMMSHVLLLYSSLKVYPGSWNSNKLLSEVKIFYYYLLNCCESLWPGLHSFFLLENETSAVPTCHKSQVSLLWLVRGLSVCTQKHFGWRPSTTPLGNWQWTESFQTNTHFWISLLMPSWPLYFPTSPFVFLITVLDASKGQQQLRTVLEWQMNVLACRPSGWCANRFQWWPSNKTPSLESWCSSGLGTEMNFVREWRSDSERCLPAGRRSRIINRSNIPLHPDSPSRTHLWQESVETHLTVKDTDKDQSPYDSWHEIRGPKKQALSLAKHIIGSPSPVTDDIIMSELRDGYWQQTAMRHYRLTLSFFYCWIFYGLPGNKSFVSRKLKTVVTVLNIPVHAWTALPGSRREPAEQDATCHGLLVQRQAETNNAAPYLEGIIPTEVWGYLCWVWEYVMSVAIPMCQLVS